LAVVTEPLDEFLANPEAADTALVIEISDSTLRLDRTRKAPIYGAAGIPEYWILNLRDRALEMHREPTPDGYGYIKRIDERASVRPLHADVEVTVADLLPRG
jgi:Uma2 family endonuclease